MVEFPLRDQ